MKYTNYKKIDSIEFLYPELMSKDAQTAIRSLFEKMQMTKEMISETSMLLEELKKQFDEYDKKWNKLSSIAKVKFAVEEKGEIKNTVNIGLKMGTEINKNIH